MRGGRLAGVLAVVGALGGLAVFFSPGDRGGSSELEASGRGVEATDPSETRLRSDLAAALAAKGPEYVPRTRHRNPDGSPKYTNRLLLETSPYLVQHAHNPVDWFPWGDEAFDVARRTGKPVFLSVGYATCHWCHVMEEESFEDPEIAAFLNEHYVAIKVDREERPDVDAIYMAALQASTGRGGWPMSVWLDAERRPFFAATYLPPRDGERGARMGFLSLLLRLAESYSTNRAGMDAKAAELASMVQDNFRPVEGGELPTEAVLHRRFRFLEQRFDPVEAGTAGAPKFPSHVPIRFLLRYAATHRSESALQMATFTLQKMAAGGMYDQAGGGFHRYSTDERWLVPHFEKMLYDNALLAVAYLEAWQATGDAQYAFVAKDVLRFVERDLTSSEGPFYAALDADSLTPDGAREEGYSYTWTTAELEGALGPADAAHVEDAFGIGVAGNFEADRSVLAWPSLPTLAQREQLAPLLARLHAARETRPQPLRDDKGVTAWNGLMISAFATAAHVLDDRHYAEVARRAATPFLDVRVDGRLPRSLTHGIPKGTGMLEDHAFMAAAMLDLYEATGETRWLSEATALHEVLERDFADRERGGYFRTPADHEVLLAREKPDSDGAEPSGNSVATLTLLRLYALTGDRRWQDAAHGTLKASSEPLMRTSVPLGEMALAVDALLRPIQEIVLVGREPGSTSALRAAARSVRVNHVLVDLTEAEVERTATLIPPVSGKLALGGVPTAFVCEQGRCERPLTDPAELVALLRRKAESPEP